MTNHNKRTADIPITRYVAAGYLTQIEREREEEKEGQGPGPGTFSVQPWTQLQL